jgi:hypothetical protein
MDDAAFSDISLVRDFVTKVPKHVQPTVAAQLSRRWAEREPVRASEWIVTMLPGEMRDRAASELVLAALDQPEEALRNAAAIADPKLRIATATEVINLWREIDPVRTKAILANTAFADEERTHMISAAFPEK